MLLTSLHIGSHHKKNGIMLGDEHSKKTTPGLGSPITLVLGETGGEHNFVIF